MCMFVKPAADGQAGVINKYEEYIVLTFLLFTFRPETMGVGAAVCTAGHHLRGCPDAGEQLCRITFRYDVRD